MTGVVVPRRPISATKPCVICAQPCLTYQATLCPRCMRLRDRFCEGNPIRTDALRRSWSPRLGGFVCHYSGVLLTDDTESPWCLSFDLRDPLDESDAVLSAQLVTLPGFGGHSDRSKYVHRGEASEKEVHARVQGRGGEVGSGGGQDDSGGGP